MQYLDSYLFFGNYCLVQYHGDLHIENCGLKGWPHKGYG